MNLSKNFKIISIYTYILFKVKDTGFKESLKNLKAYNKIKKKKHLFNTEEYLKNNIDVKDLNMDPILHYIYKGFSENRKISNFDTDYYVQIYPDVKKNNFNPLVHYVLYGEKEGRFPNKTAEENSIEYKLNLIETKLKTQEIYLHQSLNLNVYKDRVLSEFENLSDLGITNKKRNPCLIVSLTSYPERMYDIHYCLYSLLTQTVKPDEIILWLSKEEFPNLEKDVPKKVIQLKNYGLTIKWVDENLKSYKKLVYALEEYPEDIIVTADDDSFYPKDWLEKLYNEYDGLNILAHRVHKIKYKNGIIDSYNKWKYCVINNELSFLNFFTGVGGVLYPPNSLYKDVLNRDLFKKLAPDSDDIWFWAMAVLNNKKIKVVKNPYNIIMNLNPARAFGLLADEKTLWSKNQYDNDKQLQNVLKHYPKLEKIIFNSFQY